MDVAQATTNTSPDLSSVQLIKWEYATIQYNRITVCLKHHIKLINIDTVVVDLIPLKCLRNIPFDMYSITINRDIDISVEANF